MANNTKSTKQYKKKQSVIIPTNWKICCNGLSASRQSLTRVRVAARKNFPRARSANITRQSSLLWHSLSSDKLLMPLVGLIGGGGGGGYGGLYFHPSIHPSKLNSRSISRDKSWNLFCRLSHVSRVHRTGTFGLKKMCTICGCTKTYNSQYCCNFIHCLKIIIKKM